MLDDMLLMRREQLIEIVEPTALELSKYAFDVRSIGNAWAVKFDPKTLPADDPRGVDTFALDANDIVCLLEWAIVVLPDVTFLPGQQHIQILRQPGEATSRVLARHTRHWNAEHREPPPMVKFWMPEAPTP